MINTSISCAYAAKYNNIQNPQAPKFGFIDFNGNGFDAMDVAVYSLLFDSSSSTTSSGPSQATINKAKEVLKKDFNIGAWSSTGVQLLKEVEVLFQKQLDSKNAQITAENLIKQQEYQEEYLPQYQAEHAEKNFITKLFHRKKQPPKLEKTLNNVSLEFDYVLHTLTTDYQSNTTEMNDLLNMFNKASIITIKKGRVYLNQDVINKAKQ